MTHLVEWVQRALPLGIYCGNILVLKYQLIIVSALVLVLKMEPNDFVARFKKSTIVIILRVADHTPEHGPLGGGKFTSPAVHDAAGLVG